MRSIRVRISEIGMHSSCASVARPWLSIVSAVLSMAGIRDVVSKMLGSKSKINNVHAVMLALSKLQSRAAAKPKA